MSKKIIKSNLEELAKKIIELKENFQVNALNGLLDLKWNIGKELLVSRVTQETYRFLGNKTGIHYRELQRDVKFYEKYPNKDYPQLAWRKFANQLLIESPQENIFEPKLFNIWYFQERDPNLGKEHPGNIPGQIVENLLYYFTQENDLVVDPLGGGGSTLDACKKHNRRCLIYDLQPRRDDIKQHDITIGFPNEAKNCDLIFLDPPYWSQKKGEYTNLNSDLSNMSLDEFYNTMKKLAQNCQRTIKQNGYVALIIGASQKKNEFIDWGFKCYQIFEKYFNFVNRINIPYSTQQYPAYRIQQVKDNKQMLNLYRDLIIWQKL